MPITGRTRISTLLGIDSYVEEVLEEYGIDLEAVDGDTTLEQACRRAGVNYWEVKSELVATLPGDDSELAGAWEDLDDDGDDDDDDEQGDEAEASWDEDEDDWEDEDEDEVEDEDEDDWEEASGAGDEMTGGVRRRQRGTRWGDWK